MTEPVASICTSEDLAAAAVRGRKTLYPLQPKILVGTATCGQAAGSLDVLEAVQDEVAKNGLPYLVAETGCIGWCCQEPLLDVWLPGKGRITYGRMKPGRARQLVGSLPKDLKLDWAIAWMPGDDNTLTGEWTNYVLGADGLACPPTRTCRCSGGSCALWHATVV